MRYTPLNFVQSNIILGITMYKNGDLNVPQVIMSCHTTYTQNGTYPSCKPQQVKYFRLSTSWLAGKKIIKSLAKIEIITLRKVSFQNPTNNKTGLIQNDL